MFERFGKRLWAICALSLCAAFGGVSAVQADELLAARLGALLGQERAAIQQVPDIRVAALTAVPPASVRNIPTAPDIITYDRAFLASQPAASGGEQWRCLAEALYFEARGDYAYPNILISSLSFQEVIDLSDLAPGMYNLVVIIENANTTSYESIKLIRN